MTDYLSYSFDDTEEFINTFDELPLWSASFGLLLLKHIPLRSYSTVLDLGSGAGFPLMELAARLGSNTKLYGIDPWKNANKRARQKIINYQLDHVEIIETSAENLPFENNSIDLIVSNLGINNFDNPSIVFKECQRVLKPSSKLILTSNINGHWKEFYLIFEQTLSSLNMHDQLNALQKHQEHRGDVNSISALFVENGFEVSKIVEENFTMRFLDGSTFLRHYFVKLGWLLSWKELIAENDQTKVFELLEENLNKLATQHGELEFSVPMLYIEGLKKL